MMDLTGIESASGLSAADKAVLGQLIDVHNGVSGRNAELSQYYEAEQPTPSIGIDNIPDTVQPGSRCDWAAKAVDSVAERVRLDGFTFAEGYEDAGLSRAMRDNGFRAAFNRHVSDELIHGCMFATVNRTGRGVALRMHTAQTSAAIWDESAQRIGAGFVLADARRTPWSPYEPVPVQVNMHLPGRVVQIMRRDAARWKAVPAETPLDRPMMEAFCFRPTGVKRFGQTRIKKAVRYLVDEVERTMRYMAVSNALYATPKDILLGLTDKQFDAMAGSKWSTMVTSMFLATRDGQGNTPEYTRLASASPQPYIDAISMYAKMFSGVTGVPLNSLGVVQDNPSSAEAIMTSREDVCNAAEDCIEGNSEGLRQVALMAMAVQAGRGFDALTEEQLSVMPNFKSPMTTSLAANADAMTKVAGVLEGFAQTREFLSGMGFASTEVESIKSQLDAGANQRAILSIMGGSPNAAAPGAKQEEPKAGSDEAEVKGKALNGAQTQSLIAIMSQFSSGAITEGQAVNLISTAIGLSKADASAILNGDMGD